MLAGRLEHANRPEHVHIGVEVGPIHGRPHVDLRGEVEAHFRALEVLVEELAHVVDLEARALRDVLVVAVRHVVDDDLVVAAGQ